MTEYSGLSFGGFFIGEYSFILAMSAWTSLMFTGHIWGLFIVLFAFLWVRGTFVRIRYDQLMYLGWMIILPISIGYLSFTFSLNTIPFSF